MLLELRVENYAIIDHAVVEFAAGLNLLTGETGAGKSILIDALSLLLGARASTDLLRHGSDKAAVSALFSVESAGVAKLLDEAGIEAESSELILRREILGTGKARVFVNNQPATVSLLKQLAPHVGWVHAQNESLAAFDSAEKRMLLDECAALDAKPLGTLFQRQREIRQQIAELERGEQDKLRLLDMWSFQKKEIEGANLQAGEDVKLEAEKRILANAERLYSAAMTAHEVLYEAEGSAAASIRAAERQVEELARYDEKFRETAASLNSARIAVEDAGASLRDYAQAIDASPQRLAQVEERLALLERLKRKYGATIDDVIAFGADVARKINEVENRDEILATLRRQLGSAEREYLQAARELSGQRRSGAKEMERAAEAEVNELAMKARFQVEVTSSEKVEHWSANGIDSIEFLVATNAGEPMQPLEQIASGGELSRVMLALKLVTQTGAKKAGGSGKSTRQPVTQPETRMLVFDEIDTGIGGRAAEAVGRKLKALARGHQVLCITHLPQIASFADHHLLIEKRQVGGRTKTLVQKLEPQERRNELARMMSGTQVTETSIQHADEMLKANA